MNISNIYYIISICTIIGIFLKIVLAKSSSSSSMKLALCHARKHNHDILSLIDKPDNWFMVDKCVNDEPDYVCDVTNKTTMQLFKDNSVKIIASMYFPLGINKRGYLLMLENVWRIIKPNGKLYLTEMPNLIYHYVSKNTVKKLMVYYNPMINPTIAELQPIKCNNIDLRNYLLERKYDDHETNIMVLINLTNKNNNSNNTLFAFATAIDCKLVESISLNLVNKYVLMGKFKIRERTCDFLIVDPIK